MKGYYTPFGYMGLIDGRYRLYSSEEEYIEAYREFTKSAAS